VRIRDVPGAEVICWFALVLGSLLLLPTVGRAQRVSGVELHWEGPTHCAEPSGVLESARTLLGRDADPSLPLVVQVELRDAADGSLSVALQAQRAGVITHRTVTMSSCEEARQMAALFIALAVDPAASAEAPAPDPEPEQAKPDAVPTEPARASADVQPPPKDAPQSTPHAPRADRSGPILGVAAGVELPAASRVSAVFAARFGWRWGGFRLEAAANAWLPSHGRIHGVDLALDRLGGAARACRLFAFARWELGPCLGFEVSRVHAELNGADAGAAAWARASLGPRLGLWLTDALTLELSIDPMLALNRPRFASESAGSAHAPAASFVSSLGISYAFGAHAPATME
jgi:hypothetical protein